MGMGHPKFVFIDLFFRIFLFRPVRTPHVFSFFNIICHCVSTFVVFEFFEASAYTACLFKNKLIFADFMSQDAGSVGSKCGNGRYPPMHTLLNVWGVPRGVRVPSPKPSPSHFEPHDMAK